MYTKKLSGFLVAAFLSISTSFAQSLEIKTSDNDAIKITPAGRFYLDGATYFDDETKLGNGVYVSDIRLGFKAKYQKFDFKIDMGFSGGKVDPKDIFLQYNLNKKSYIRAGYFAEPFGIDHMESSANIKFITANVSSLSFSPGRKVGFEYIGWAKSVWVGAGVFADGDALKKAQAGNQGYSVAGRFVYNPLQDAGRIFHVGLSGTYRKADASGYDDLGNPLPRTITYSSRGNTNVERRNFLNASISDASYQAKYAAELIGAYGPLYLQAEYFHANVERAHSMPAYKASGAYAQLGFLAIGGDYTYSTSWARMGTPKPKSLEFAVRYNYTDLNDDHAKIYGGRMSDWSVAANYYLNKYVMFRLNYTNMAMGKNGPFAAGENINEIQARVQVVF